VIVLAQFDGTRKGHFLKNLTYLFSLLRQEKHLTPLRLDSPVRSALGLDEVQYACWPNRFLGRDSSYGLISLNVVINKDITRADSFIFQFIPNSVRQL